MRSQRYLQAARLEFGHRLYELRLLNKVGVEVLAERLDIDATVLEQIEKGVQLPESHNSLAAHVAALGAAEDYMRDDYTELRAISRILGGSESMAVKLGRLLRYYREEFKGLQIDDAARQTGFAPATFLPWEVGLEVPTHDNVMRLASAYELMIDQTELLVQTLYAHEDEAGKKEQVNSEQEVERDAAQIGTHQARRLSSPSGGPARISATGVDTSWIPAIEPDTRPTISAEGAAAIFISYRRDDHAGFAGRIFDRLTINFGEGQVLCDAHIEPGNDFVDELKCQLDGCKVIIAVIGTRWLNIRDDAGKRRLDDPADYVRMEIERGLNRDIPVVPVLVDGARMPSLTDLPASLEPFARRNGYSMSNIRFHSEITALILWLERLLYVE
jgi:transcriptional regulator with XRE-family HTH domain